jgi:hypothetical protein
MRLLGANNVARKQYTESERDTLVNAILERYSQGEGLKGIIQADGMPGWATLWEWRKLPQYKDRFATAKEMNEEAYFDEIEGIIEEAPERMLTENGDRVDPGDVANKKLKIWGRLQILARRNPKKYGEKAQIEHSGSLSIADGLRAARAKREGKDES